MTCGTCCPTGCLGEWQALLYYFVLSPLLFLLLLLPPFILLPRFVITSMSRPS